MQSAGKNGGKTWTQSYQQRRMAQRIAENLSIAENLRKKPSNATPPRQPGDRYRGNRDQGELVVRS